MRLVLLHALPFGGRMWEAQQQLLPGRTIAPTMYDMGDTLEAWAAGVLELVGEEPMIVVGCSVGGSVAIEVARAAPQQVLGMVLVGAKAGVRPERAVRDAGVEMLEQRGMQAAWSIYWEPLLGPNTTATTREAARTMARDQSVADVVRGVRAFHDRRDNTAFMNAWDGPLVVISGEHDSAPLSAVTEALGTGRGRQFHRVADCGHYVNLEQPDRFAALVGDAIARFAPT